MANSILKENPALHKELLQQRRAKYKSLKAKMNANRTFSDKFADVLTEAFGSVGFLVFNIMIFLVWIPVNLGFVPGVAIFDPFPFGLLTTAVSLEAIFLAIIVLISQNRSARIAELREELDLHINVQAEEEITKTLVILDRINKHLGMPEMNDSELIVMEQKTNLDDIEEELKKEL